MPTDPRFRQDVYRAVGTGVDAAALVERRRAGAVEFFVLLEIKREVEGACKPRLIHSVTGRYF